MVYYSKKQKVTGFILFVVIIGTIIFAISYFGVFLSIMKWIGLILLGIILLIGLIWLLKWIIRGILNFFGWLGSWRE